MMTEVRTPVIFVGSTVIKRILRILSVENVLFLHWCCDYIGVFT